MTAKEYRALLDTDSVSYTHLADMAIIISHKIHIEVCQWLLNGMIVAALLNLCGKIQTKCKLEKIW